MAPPVRAEITDKSIRGLKYFRSVRRLLRRLHDVGTARDRAGNRQLFYDQYVGLLLLAFFNPILASLRGLQQASTIAKVQELLGVHRTSLGSLSEASGVFKAAPLAKIVHELAGQAVPLERGSMAEALRGLTAVDGSLLPALPRMAWALWQDGEHRAAKMHVEFDVLKGIPCDATITPGASSEPEQFRRMLHPNRLYVTDRGYANYQLFRDILDAGSSFVARVKDNTAFTVAQEKTIPAEAQAVGVIRDCVLARLGTDRHKDCLRQQVRLVIVRRTKPNGEPEELWLVTDRLDLPAELVALAYRYRWTIELFFHWLKNVLGCKHLLSESANGVAIQVYVALIASLLIVLWTGCKPSKRTWEMIQMFVGGWATLDELIDHLQARQEASAKKRVTA